MSSQPRRVLHVLDSGTGGRGPHGGPGWGGGGGEGAVLACAAAMRAPEALGLDQRAWVLGPPADLRWAVAAGVRPAEGVTTFWDIPETAVRSIWRLRAALKARAWHPDVVIAWSPASLHLAATVFGPSLAGAGLAAASRGGFPNGTADLRPPALVGVMPTGPGSDALQASEGVSQGGRLAGWLRKRRLAAAVHRTTIIPLGRTLEHAWAGSAGLGFTAIPSPIPCRPAGEDFAAARAALRRELRLPPREVAVMLLADPPVASDVRHLSQTLGMVRLAGLPVSGLVHRSADDWSRGLHFRATHGKRWDLLRIDTPLWAALPAADICVWMPLTSRETGGGPGEHASVHLARAVQGQLLPLAALALGIPVIAPNCAAARELLGPAARTSDAAEACLVSGAAERLIAGALLRLADPAERARAAAAHLRTHAGPPAAPGTGDNARFHAHLSEALRQIVTGSQAAMEWWEAAAKGRVA